VEKISPLLKQKIQQLNYDGPEPLVSDELTELDSIIKDTAADIEERVLAARVMLNVAENRKQRAIKQVTHWTNIHSALVHESEKGKAVKSLTKEGLDKLASVPGIEDLLQAMVDRLKK
jgi:hypothetical protein